MSFSKTRLGGIAFACLAFASSAQAGTIGLSTNYKVGFTTKVFLREASGITYNWDHNSLFVVGDGGTAGEYGLDGKPYMGNGDFGSIRFADSEGVTYIGGGRYVVADERVAQISAVGFQPFPGQPGRFLLDAPTPAFQYTVSGGPNWGNSGLEGVSYDPLTGGYFAIKENNPQGVFFVSKDFNIANSPGTTTPLFDPALLGLATLSDIQTFSTVAAFKGTDLVSNLLILSQSSKKLLEVTRSGEVLSSFDLSNILGTTGFVIKTIEGVTFDKDGNIYLAAETGEADRGLDSALIKLERIPAAAAVPEPATWALMISGFGMVGASMRRRRVAVRFA